MVARHDTGDADAITRSLLAGIASVDPEGWAAISGMLAMLALPPIGERQPAVEVELGGEWHVIHAVRIARTPGFLAPCVVFHHGVNGHSRQWTVEIDGPGRVPRWRPLLSTGAGRITIGGSVPT